MIVCGESDNIRDARDKVYEFKPLRVVSGEPQKVWITIDQALKARVNRAAWIELTLE
jgi:hypothetical protein